MATDRGERTGARGQRRLRAACVLQAVVIVLAAALGLAACAGSAKPTTTTTSVPPETLPPLKTSVADITYAYKTLFDLTNPEIAPKLAVVQGGSSLKSAFTKAVHSALAKEAASAKVVSVKIEQGTACSKELLPSPCAGVIYDVLSPTGSQVLTDSSGGAVYLSSRWLVSKATICALLTFVNISC